MKSPPPKVCVLVDIHEAKTRLSAWVRRAHAGEEIVIARAGLPVARLVPIHVATARRSGVRIGGLKAARLKLSPSFHAPLSDDHLLDRMA